ncbi:MAG TPA: hypothetical protein VFB54_00315 [Burkholderiales bacterium]|nr:hypothetical protein [Burkholderiales bacterium]
MTRRQPDYHLAAVLFCGIALASAAYAGDPQPLTAFTKQLPDEQLANERGGDSTTEVLNKINMTGSADHISVHNALTGDNFITGGSFSGAQGFPMVIQNTGNGVLIQNATIINLSVKP